MCTTYPIQSQQTSSETGLCGITALSQSAGQSASQTGSVGRAVQNIVGPTRHVTDQTSASIVQLQSISV
jgi:hypothetical protein